jgi:hypothetical protein
MRDLISTIRTENAKVRFSVYRREDGRFEIDEERYQAGDEYTGPYWSDSPAGLFGSVSDVNEYLSSVSPKPVDKLIQPN